MSRCTGCGRELTADEIALYRRLVHRAATEFLCLDCLSKRLGVTVEELREKIDLFRRAGCTLFD